MMIFKNRVALAIGLLLLVTPSFGSAVSEGSLTYGEIDVLKKSIPNYKQGHRSFLRRAIQKHYLHELSNQVTWDTVKDKKDQSGLWRLFLKTYEYKADFFGLRILEVQNKSKKYSVKFVYSRVEHNIPMSEKIVIGHLQKFYSRPSTAKD